MTNSGRRCGRCHLCSCHTIHLIVALGCDTAAGVRDTGKMDDLVDSFEQRMPIDCLRKIAMLHDLYAVGKRRLRRAPHRGADHESVGRKCLDDGAANEAGRTSDQDAAHFLPRANAARSKATSAVPPTSAAMSLSMPGTITVNTANAQRMTLTTKTRATTSATV